MLLDKIKTTPVRDGESSEQTEARVKEESTLSELRYQLWAELVQCLDRKSVMFLRAYRGDGTTAWNALQQNYRSTERPRIHKTMTSLTGLKMEHSESMADYLTRAESLQMDLHDVNEAMNDTMFCAMVLKGLPQEYDNLVTVLNYGDKKAYGEMKVDLINFSNSKPVQQHQGLYSGNAGKNSQSNMKCFTSARSWGTTGTTVRR